jgi:predicted transcriptional regulator YdeE
MVSISVPTYTFVTTSYEGDNTYGEYVKLYEWIELNNYQLDQQELESLEKYPIDYNPLTDVPKLEIFIPIKEK